MGTLIFIVKLFLRKLRPERFYSYFKTVQCLTFSWLPGVFAVFILEHLLQVQNISISLITSKTELFKQNYWLFVIDNSQLKISHFDSDTVFPLFQIEFSLYLFLSSFECNSLVSALLLLKSTFYWQVGGLLRLAQSCEALSLTT